MANKNRVFLAHANEDKSEVRQLYKKLKAHGFSPWLDAVDLIPGQNWREEIPKVIENAAICLACLSKQSVAKEGYVQREFRYALSACADRPPGAIYLIPVRFDECDVPDISINRLELSLRDLHWVDLFDVDGFEQLVSAVRLKVKPCSASSDNQPRLLPESRAFEVFRDIYEPWCPEMVIIPAGTFLMGSPNDEVGRERIEDPQHEVTISRAFALGRYPISFDEYDYFCKVTGRRKPRDQGWGRGRRPVIHVTYDDATAYCTWLSEIAGRLYRLPSEAQWEYACRSETTTPFSFGANITTDQSNYDGNHPYADSDKGRCREQTMPVGSLPANDFGLHEMHGNVWEWCVDWLGEYPQTSVKDPHGPAGGEKRVVRGGSWFSDARQSRSAGRNAYRANNHYSYLGFRCAGVLKKS